MDFILCIIDYTQIQTDMKKLFIVVMACYALTARSQVDESRNFLYLYSDSVIYANKIRLRPDFLDSWQLRADSRRVPTQQVKFFNNEEGFFANTRKLDYGNYGSFSERIIQGRINLYQQIVYDPLVYDRYSRFRHRRATAADISLFYNKSFNDLKKVNYRNLKTDMADQAESMALLNMYRKRTNTGNLLYGAAGAAVIASLVIFVTEGSRMTKDTGFGGYQTPELRRSNFTGSFLMLGLGLGFAAGGFYLNRSGSRYLERAVEAYNR